MADIEKNMLASGWQVDDFSVGVLTPELEVVLWPGNDGLLADLVRFNLAENINDWLASNGWVFDEQGIPSKPKEALELLIKINRTGKNVKHALVCKNFAKLAPIDNCIHNSFNFVTEKVREWFPLEQV